MVDHSLPLYLAGAFLSAFLLALVLTWRVRGWATERGLVDRPDGVRRLHAKPIPSIGGVSIAVSSVLVFMFAVVLLPGFPAVGEMTPIVVMLLGGGVAFAIGLADDLLELRAWTKFLLQIVLATAVFLAGVRISVVSIGFVETGVFPFWVSLLVTVVWLVGTTNAFNLIDGADGLAAGAALFASASLAVVFALNGDLLGAVMALTLAGACLGFLFFNFPPASIFMGDSGSLFIGFTLAALGVITANKASTAVAVAVPILAFGLPLLDTSLAMARRFLRREPIFRADRGHLHHRLRDLGHSPKQVAILAYLACAGFASLSLLLTGPGRPSVLPVFVIAGLVLLVAVQRLNIPELVELQQVLGRGLQQREVIAHNLRVREAAVRLSARNVCPAEIVRALRYAFDGGEFDRMDAWLPGPLAKPVLPSLPEARPSENGFRWRWELGSVASDTRQLVEVRVPLFSSREEEEPIGRLSLYRRVDRDRLYTDVRLLVTLLGPALMSALERIGAATEGPALEAAGHDDSVGSSKGSGPWLPSEPAPDSTVRIRPR